MKIEQYTKADGTVVPAYNKSGVRKSSEQLPADAKRSHLEQSSAISEATLNIRMMERSYPTIDVAFFTLAGSRAYGLSTSESDVDARGMFFETDRRKLLGLGRMTQTYRNDVTDTELHEFGKFVSLASDGNPNTLELLWMEPIEGSLEVEGLDRSDLLFADRIKAKHKGFANGQMRRAATMRSENKHVGDGEKSYRKLLRHGWRIMRQAEELLSTGEMNIEVTDEEKSFYEWLYENPDELDGLFESKINELSKMDSVLPDFDDNFGFLSDLVAEHRLSRLT